MGGKGALNANVNPMGILRHYHLFWCCVHAKREKRERKVSERRDKIHPHSMPRIPVSTTSPSTVQCQLTCYGTYCQLWQQVAICVHSSTTVANGTLCILLNALFLIAELFSAVITQQIALGQQKFKLRGLENKNIGSRSYITHSKIMDLRYQEKCG